MLREGRVTVPSNEMKLSLRIGSPNPRALRQRGRRALFTLTALVSWLSLSAGFTQSPATAIAESDAVEVPTANFNAAHIKKGSELDLEVLRNQMGKSEAWAKMSFVVTVEGKVIEPQIADSSGNKDFEKGILLLSKGWQMEPGTLNGKPIESVRTLKFTIQNYDRKHERARPEFADNYAKFLKVLATPDRASTDIAIKVLQPDNLYEDAYMGLAEYHYAHKWGTDEQQLAGLLRAVADEDHGIYLPKATFAQTIEQLFLMQVKLGYFADATDTWGELQKLLDKQTLASLQPVADRIEIFRKSSEEFGVAAEIKDRYWYFSLFKRHFRVDVTTGHIANVRLYCQRKFVQFQFDPQLQYTVWDTFGHCSITLTGDPGTKFRFFES